MTAFTVDLQGVTLGFSLTDYRDLSFLKNEACWMLGISRERLNQAIKCAKEINKSIGGANFTCDRTTDTWIAYEHIRQVAVWLAIRGNIIAREFAYLMQHNNLIDALRRAYVNADDDKAADTIEQWSVHFDWVTRIGYVLDMAIDKFATSEETFMPFLSIDPICWRISERIAEFGYSVAQDVIRSIKYSILSNIENSSLVVFPEDNEDDIEVKFELLPLLDDAIRSVVHLS